MDFTGTRAVVTGGASGIGEAVVRRLAAQGARVMIADIAPERGGQLAAELSAAGSDVFFCRVDVADAASVEAGIRTAVDRFGGLDILIYNAGITEPNTKLEDEASELYEKLIRVDLIGAFYYAKYALPYIRERKGNVVTISSTSGVVATMNDPGYSSAKHGIIGLTKNKYIGRTFIAPTQSQRETGVSLKLNPVRSAVQGKRIVLIDDSIVRGTTCRHIIDLLRSAGAREIHMRVSAPPFISPCYYGTDIDSADGLIANRHTTEEIARIIGVDSLGYLSLEHVRLLTGEDSGFCTACFGGGYPTAIPQGGKSRLEG